MLGVTRYEQLGMYSTIEAFRQGHKADNKTAQAEDQIFECCDYY
jgi:hypothetical protein